MEGYEGEVGPKIWLWLHRSGSNSYMCKSDVIVRLFQHMNGLNKLNMKGYELKCALRTLSIWYGLFTSCIETTEHSDQPFIA